MYMLSIGICGENFKEFVTFVTFVNKLIYNIINL